MISTAGCETYLSSGGLPRRVVMIMDKMVFVPFVVMLLLLTACAPSGAPAKDDEVIPEEDRLFCETDDDCVCGGVDEATGRCFLGNRDYYEEHVDKSGECPDFCSGINGNLVVKCVDNTCMQVMECLTDMDCESGVCEGNRCVGEDAGGECASDSDCRTGGCSGELCVLASEGRRASICEFRPEYECYSMIDCGCVNGYCRWKETAEFMECVGEAKSSGDESPV